MQETWLWFLGWEDLLEEGMATHSSILTWRISLTVEPGRLQSMGSQRVRQTERPSPVPYSIGATGATRQEQPGPLEEMVKPSCPPLDHHRSHMKTIPPALFKPLLSGLVETVKPIATLVFMPGGVWGHEEGKCSSVNTSMKWSLRCTIEWKMQVAKEHIDVWFHLGCIMCEPHVHRETRRFLYVHIHTWKSTEKG